MIFKRFLVGALVFCTMIDSAMACGYAICPACLFPLGPWTASMMTVNGVQVPRPPVVMMTPDMSAGYMQSLNRVTPGICTTVAVGSPVTPNVFTSTTTCAGRLRSKTFGVMVPMFPVYNPWCPYIQPWVSFGNPAVSVKQTTTEYNWITPPIVTVNWYHLG